eukprot:scaffold66939_cov46-Prasinocladus_malaysianus.AAC.1
MPQLKLIAIINVKNKVDLSKKTDVPVVGGELQRVNHAQNLVEIASSGGGVEEGQLELLVRANDEDGCTENEHIVSAASQSKLILAQLGCGKCPPRHVIGSPAAFFSSGSIWQEQTQTRANVSKKNIHLQTTCQYCSLTFYAIMIQTPFT